MTIEIIKVDQNNPTALYKHYGNQINRQPVYVQLSLESGELSVRVDTEIGNSTPIDVWSGKSLVWQIPLLSPRDANQLMEDLALLCQEILDESEIIWNGSSYVGKLTDRGRDLRDCVEQEISDSHLESIEEWYVDDYCAHETVRDLTDAELAELADKIKTYAAGNNVILRGDVLEYLTTRRDR